MSIKENLERIRALAEARDDPAFAPILEAVRVKCVNGIHLWRGPHLLANSDYCCQDCGGAAGTPFGYTTRDWPDLPEGALWGSLALAIEDADEATVTRYENAFASARLEGKEHDLAATEAVLEAMEVQDA